MFLPVLGVKLRSVSDDEDWRLHGLEGEKGGGEEEEVGRALKGVGGPENEGRSSPNTGLPGKHDTYTRTQRHTQRPQSVTTSPSERWFVFFFYVCAYMGVGQC